MVTTKAFTFPRSHFIGFEKVWNEIERLQDVTDNKTYPPHNIVKIDEEKFQVELALAGYKKEELNVEVREGILVITAEIADREPREFVHKGISQKKFRRTFRLSEHVVVDGADFEDGLLVIDLRVELPLEQRPRNIAIG
jgi:molecular chaperone IbpA